MGSWTRPPTLRRRREQKNRSAAPAAFVHPRRSVFTRDSRHGSIPSTRPTDQGYRDMTSWNQTSKQVAGAPPNMPAAAMLLVALEAATWAW